MTYLPLEVFFVESVDYIWDKAPSTLAPRPGWLLNSEGLTSEFDSGRLPSSEIL